MVQSDRKGCNSRWVVGGGWGVLVVGVWGCVCVGGCSIGEGPAIIKAEIKNFAI